MYLNKFSSGTILALLALSGILLLVPFGASVQATQNASLPTLSTNHNLVVGHTLTETVTITITNPSTNAYPITAITVTAPTGWNFTSATPTVTGPTGTTTTVTSLTAIAFSGFSILPGFQATLTTQVEGPNVAATAAPSMGTFGTSLVDGGSAGAYVGPTFALWSISAPVSVTLTSSPVSLVFTAGSAPYTLTAQLGSNEPNVPLTFTVTSGAGSFTSTIVSTGSTGAATVSFAPTNTAGNPSAIVQASAATTVAATSNSLDFQTVNAAPSSITFHTGSALGPVLPSTYYIYNSHTPAISGAFYAEVPVSTIYYAISDAYGNAVTTASTISGTFSATNGFFDETTTKLTTGTYTTATGAITDEYDQSGTYAAVGLISASFTGKYGASNTNFAVGGSTGNLQTSLLNIAGITLTPTTNGITAITGNVAAGTFVIPSVVLGTPQAGVPVTLNLCAHTSCAGGTSKPYTGTFATNGLVSIVVNTVTSSTAPQTGNASAHFNVDTTAGRKAVFNATVAAPENGTPTNIIPVASVGPTAVTVAGSAASFKIAFDLISTGDGPSTNIVASGTGYVNVFTADKFGNVVITGLPQQTQIGLAATGGSLSVSSAYIPSGAFETNETAPVYGFGTISWTLPSTLGTYTLTASGVLGGVATSTPLTVTVVSPSPTISVTSPSPKTVAGVTLIPSQSPAVVFTGKAAASVGYPSSSSSCVAPYVCVSSVSYKIGTGHWQTAATTSGNSITWSIAAIMPQGLSTIQFNASDSHTPSNVAVSTTYTVLVDSSAPTFAFSSATSTTGSTTVTVTTTEGDFNETTFVATYNGVTIPSSSITWSGTQTLGSSSVVTATIGGLTTNTATLAVSGNTYTGVTGSNSETLTVTIPFSSSISFVTASAVWGSSGAAQGVFVPVTNSWNTAQQLTIYVTLKSGTSTYVLVGGLTLASGQTATVFCQDFLTSVPVGAYTVAFSAITTANQAVSSPTTPITLTS